MGMNDEMSNLSNWCIILIVGMVINLRSLWEMDEGMNDSYDWYIISGVEKVIDLRSL